MLAGTSGAGKSTALQTLSDAGFYTIDNLPLPLVPNFVQLSVTAPPKFARTALLLDIDSEEKLTQLLQLIKTIKDPQRLKLMFIDASKEKITKRYGETRRPHPYFDPARDHSLSDTIQREKELLQPLKEIAHIVIDTNEYSVHDLRREVHTFAESLGPHGSKQVRINFASFGFKYGAPIDCDLIVDVRFLPNPYFVPELKEKTGLESIISDYVLRTPQGEEFIKRYADLLSFLIPNYAAEGKAYIKIGVGCTGGKHRSVAVAQKLSLLIPEGPYLVSVKHRDLGRE